MGQGEAGASRRSRPRLGVGKTEKLIKHAPKRTSFKATRQMDRLIDATLSREGLGPRKRTALLNNCVKAFLDQNSPEVATRLAWEDVLDPGEQVHISFELDADLHDQISALANEHNARLSDPATRFAFESDRVEFEALAESERGRAGADYLLKDYERARKLYLGSFLRAAILYTLLQITA